MEAALLSINHKQKGWVTDSHRPPAFTIYQKHSIIMKQKQSENLNSYSETYVRLPRLALEAVAIAALKAD